MKIHEYVEERTGPLGIAGFLFVGAGAVVAFAAGVMFTASPSVATALVSSQQPSAEVTNADNLVRSMYAGMGLMLFGALAFVGGWLRERGDREDMSPSDTVR